ncbi:hypothetical protein AG4045_005640 [Apium graveolens]|uniref:Uncharacterized protein n=1 Tax=Apium graveolens TaxID=4045 RepID=A0A6L5BB28_APIGR|nr:hypothetical protein AG4045_005640 [Apium graveolens]
MENVQICMKTLEDSPFFQSFLTQIERPQLSDSILKVLGTESSMQMANWGIDMLERIILIGNTFTRYMHDWIFYASFNEKWEFIRNSKKEYILAALSFTKEFEIAGTTKHLTTEAIRKDHPNEDWLHLTALVHGI